ncbi:hypothetical protein HFRIS_001669 [Herbaspirillum frisingense GSF30]|uniref:Reverse transcriptase domain-containing protein n=1 Tax=Herbaspirillum frisingense GSF30 TaxID=864073 RepID=A0AAI9N5M4_9BURK|nr:hypothetical protein HFRIS_001669 [Herbaspirillum frisingense GSF30]
MQTDISSFYEHIYHHRIEGFLNGLFPETPKLAIQLDRFLSKLASGRSFGLPVGGQCSRVLAELVMQVVDTALTDHGIKWHRYVDDFVLITASQAEAYQAVATLSNVLADLGLSLNKSKTTILSGRHFIDYVRTQLGSDEDSATISLKEIDLRFDPYSDTALEDYTALRGLVEHIDLQKMLKLELEKSVPDTFLVAQIGRTLRYQEPAIALKLVEALLAPANLHAFRASWSTIMRGIAAVRDDEQFETIFEGIDSLLDEVAIHSSHLLTVDTSCLHYLRALRYRKTEKRAQFVSSLYRSTQSVIIKRACIDCWRIWKDFAAFMQVRNRWQIISPEEQRMLWLCSKSFDDDGKNFRSQEKRSALRYWALGMTVNHEQEFAEAFIDWAQSWS